MTCVMSTGKSFDVDTHVPEPGQVVAHDSMLVQNQGKGQVAMLTIPGLMHPVRDMYLEDALERTKLFIGRGSKYAP